MKTERERKERTNCIAQTSWEKSFCRILVFFVFVVVIVVAAVQALACCGCVLVSLCYPHTPTHNSDGSTHGPALTPNLMYTLHPKSNTTPRLAHQAPHHKRQDRQTD